MATSSGLYLGVDLGGTNIQAGLMGDGDQITTSQRIKTKAEEGLDAVVGRIVKLIEKTVAAAGVKVGDLAGIGIGAPGVIDFKKRTVVMAVNLGWNDVPLAKRLHNTLGVPVILDNDVNVGTWGEVKAGAAQKFTDVLGVFVGTGVGGGLVLGGQPYHGFHMTAGEIGHTHLAPDAPFGSRTFENRAGRTAIVNTLTALIRANHPSALTEITGGDLSRIRSKALAKAYEMGDDLTVRVIHQAADDVGIAIANAVTLLSLEAAVLGGGVTEALGQPFVKRVEKSFRNRVFPPQLGECPILAGALGDDAALIGAAWLARHHLADTP